MNRKHRHLFCVCNTYHWDFAIRLHIVKFHLYRHCGESLESKLLRFRRSAPQISRRLLRRCCRMRVRKRCPFRRRQTPPLRSTPLHSAPRECRRRFRWRRRRWTAEDPAWTRPLASGSQVAPLGWNEIIWSSFRSKHFEKNHNPISLAPNVNKIQWS